MSTTELPKQFVPMFSGRSLFERTLTRLTQLPEASAPLIVTGSSHLHLVVRASDAAGVRPHLMIVEPDGRNTAPAAIAAALTCQSDEILAILPSDHLIDDREGFRAAVRQAADLAAEGHIVTFGVVPNRPETGYGYIERGESVGVGYQVASFKEKPPVEAAETLSSDGRHLWNSGIFVVPAGFLIDEVARLAPDVLEGVRAALGEPKEATLELDDSFAEVEMVSIDHAVMEKTSSALVIPIDLGWDDLGSFQALWALSDKDENGNAITGDVITNEVTGSLIIARSRRVAVSGLVDVVIVETPEGVLVLPRARSQDVKKLIEDAGPS